MFDYLHEFVLKDTDWGDIKIIKPIPRKGSFWGVLKPLQGTMWGDMIPVVSNLLYEQALRGHVMPLVKELGLPPRGVYRKLPTEKTVCGRLKDKTCIMATENCVLGPKLPDCYEPYDVDVELIQPIITVSLAWRDGYYIIIVNEDD